MAIGTDITLPAAITRSGIRGSKVLHLGEREHIHRTALATGEMDKPNCWQLAASGDLRDLWAAHARGRSSRDALCTSSRHIHPARGWARVSGGRKQPPATGPEAKTSQAAGNHIEQPSDILINTSMTGRHTNSIAENVKTAKPCSARNHG